jgi:hypothetical protein
MNCVFFHGNSVNQQSKLSLSRGAPLDFMEIRLYQGKMTGPKMLTFLASSHLIRQASDRFGDDD